jgi:predicted ATP-dependent protease
VTFEQSYGGIDGDSASSTEVYAIISALAGIPINQGIAVTGSVDQFGGIQAIGGVNEKIEGFFRVCKSFGLTGRQGVMIPASNVLDLHLAAEVVDAVREGRFNVWAVDTIEGGIELLTGLQAGEWSVEKGWSEGSVFGRCQERLDEMGRLMRQSAKGNTTPDEGENDADPYERDDQDDSNDDDDDDDDDGDQAHTR